MKITFIRPNLYDGRSSHAMHPLCFAILKRLTPPDVTTVFYDERLEDLSLDEPTNLVAISIEIYAARRAYKIAAEYRSRGVPVILSGAHPSLFPEECQAYADSIYIGDAEFRWAEAVEDARHG